MSIWSVNNKSGITNVGVNRQQVIKYPAFIHTHFKGITQIYVEIGVIPYIEPNYITFFRQTSAVFKAEEKWFRASAVEHR